MARVRHNMRTFYVIIVTQIFSMVGSQISSLALGMWVFAETGNATPLTLVAFFSVLPRVFAMSLSGVLADRWDRRRVMMLADAGQAAATLLLLISFASGAFELWHLYAATLIQSVFAVFQGPAFLASVTMLVPEDQRGRANALMQTTGPAAGIIGPALAGMVFALGGVIAAIAIDLLTFLVAMIAIFVVRIPRPAQTEEGRALSGTVWKEALGGLRYMWQRRILLWLVLYVALVNFLIGGAMSLGTPYILARTGSEAELGVILSIMNIGALAGAILMGVWGGTRRRMNTIMPMLLISAIFLAVTGVAQTAPALALATFGMMLPLPFINASFLTILQTKVAPDVQGRVFAATEQVAMLLLPVAYLLAGPLADRVFEPAVGQIGWEAVSPLVGDSLGAGMGLILLLAGVLMFAGSVIVFAIPSMRRIEEILPDYAPVSAETDTASAATTASAGEALAQAGA